MLVIEALCKRYGAMTALEPSLARASRAGEFLPARASGSGKTTLLQMICGLVEPEGGRCSSTDATRSSMPVHQRDIGLVFQHYALFPHLTVAREHRVSAARCAARPAAEIAGPGRGDAATMVQLGHLAGRFPRELVRRPAAARRAGALLRLPAVDHPDGRASRRARQEAARAHADRDQAAAPRDRCDHRLRHPRSGGGAGAVRPHLPDEPCAGSSSSARRTRSTSARARPSPPTSSASPTSSAAAWRRPMVSGSTTPHGRFAPAARRCLLPVQRRGARDPAGAPPARRTRRQHRPRPVAETVYAGSETRRHRRARRRRDRDRAAAAARRIRCRHAEQAIAAGWARTRRCWCCMSRGDGRHRSASAPTATPRPVRSGWPCPASCSWRSSSPDRLLRLLGLSVAGSGERRFSACAYAAHRRDRRLSARAGHHLPASRPDGALVRSCSATRWLIGWRGCRNVPRRACCSLVMVPFWTSYLVKTFAWMIMLGRSGVINTHADGKRPRRPSPCRCYTTNSA